MASSPSDCSLCLKRTFGSPWPTAPLARSLLLDLVLVLWALLVTRQLSQNWGKETYLSELVRSYELGLGMRAFGGIPDID